MLLQQFIFSLMFCSALIGYTIHRNHFLSTLLCLETMMLTLFMALSLWMSNQNSTIFSPAPILLLTLSACEAATGLALLVATTRTHATDRLSSMTILQC